MRDNNLKNKKMTKQEITREQLINTIENLNKVGIVSASGGGTDWEFLTFETELDDDNQYHYFDVWSLDSDGYDITYQLKRLIEDEDGDVFEDDEFGEDTITTFKAYTLQDIIDFHNTIF